MIKKILLTSVAITALLTTSVNAQGSLIIDPMLKGGIGAIPFRYNARIVWGDTVKNRVRRRKRSGTGYKAEGSPAVAILITGKVPDVSKRYVVAVTKDKEDFKRRFAEFKKKLSEGKRTEAAWALHLSRGLRVATKVERYEDGKKIGEPENKIGTFFLELQILELKNHGGYLTILGYEPRQGDDIVDYGYGLTDKIYGELQLDMTELEDGRRKFVMKVIKAKLTDEKLREQVYTEKSRKEIEEMKKMMKKSETGK